MLLLAADGAEAWWEVGPLLEKIEPTEPLDELIEEDILVDRAGASLWDPDINSGLNSDDEDDGAKVPLEDPTG